MKEEKNINVSKVIITIISVLVLLALIAVLTIFLTNRKQAAEVVSESSRIDIANTENVWEIKTNDNNTINNETNSVASGAEAVQKENAVTENIVVENNVTENTIVENNVTENTTNENTNIQNAVSENTTTENNQAATQNTTTAAKSTTDDKKSNNGVIWLTFDDGPSANITPKVLDILKKENIKATFFVINYSSTNEHLVKRIVEEGHTIGIHGYSHEYSKIYKSKETFMNNVYTLQDRIYKSTGVKSMYTRFPGGSSNTVSRKYCKGIMTQLTKEMLAKGFKYYDWNISSGDAGGAKNAKDVYNNVTRNLSKKRGNMVLMHDFGANKKGLEALPEIIKYAKKEGYTFAKIDDDTPMYAQHVNN